MGCDIHVALERKVKDKWVMVKRYDPFRDGEITYRYYDRFAKLAGVRGNGPEPKGLPTDISESTQLYADEWLGDAHSHSYLSLKEAISIYHKNKDVSLEEVTMWFLEYGTEQEYVDQHRIVFWFDN